MFLALSLVTLLLCFLTSLQQLTVPFLNLMPLLQSLVPWAYKQGIKSKGSNKVLQRHKNYFPSK